MRPEGEGAGAARAEGAVERAPAGCLFGPPADGGPTEAAAPAAPPSDCPAQDHLSPDANGIVRPGVRPRFDYTFLFARSDGCQPVRFNPCQPVRYALNRRLATDAHVADVVEGVRSRPAPPGCSSSGRPTPTRTRARSHSRAASPTAGSGGRRW